MAFITCGVVGFLGLMGSAGSAWAAGDFSPVVTAGVHMHSGKSGQSLTGANGYVLNFRAEKRKTVFRPQAAFEFEYLSGLASIGTATPAATLTGTSFLGGFYVFPFDQGRFQPFFGLSGILSWQLLKMAAPPTGVEANTQTYAFGYEFAAGCDLRLGSVDGNAIRIQGGLTTLNGTLAGVSGFQLAGFKVTVGLSY